MVLSSKASSSLPILSSKSTLQSHKCNQSPFLLSLALWTAHSVRHRGSHSRYLDSHRHEGTLLIRDCWVKWVGVALQSSQHKFDKTTTQASTSQIFISPFAMVDIVHQQPLTLQILWLVCYSIYFVSWKETEGNPRFARSRGHAAIFQHQLHVITIGTTS